MIQVSVDTTEIKRLGNRLRDLSGRFRSHFLRPEVEELGQRGLDILREEMPERSGALKASAGLNVISDVSFELTEGEEYGAIQRKGSPPHFIYPGMLTPIYLNHATRSKNPKEALWWPGLSHPVRWVGPPYTRVHPGFKADKYDERTRDRLLNEAPKIVNALGARIMAFLRGN